jgi:hypothetical protein
LIVSQKNFLAIFLDVLCVVVVVVVVVVIFVVVVIVVVVVVVAAPASAFAVQTLSLFALLFAATFWC